MKRPIIIAVCLAATAIGATAQTSNPAAGNRENFEEFRQGVFKRYNDFRDKINQEYAEYMRQVWKRYEAREPMKLPEEPKPITPVVFEEVPDRVPVEVKPVVIPAPAPMPKPKPIEPIREIPIDEDGHPVLTPDFQSPTIDRRPNGQLSKGRLEEIGIDNEEGNTRPDLKAPTIDRRPNGQLSKGRLEEIGGGDDGISTNVDGLSGGAKGPKTLTNRPRTPMHTFEFYGTPLEVRTVDVSKLRLPSGKEAEAADAWDLLSTPAFNNLIIDCLELRDDLALCDWAYLQMLDRLASSLCGAGTNEATMLMAYIYCQSGYEMRLGTDKNTLVMLFGSPNYVFGNPAFFLSGKEFFTYNHKCTQLNIFDRSFKGETPLSFAIDKELRLAADDSDTRTIQSKRYKGLTVPSVVNKNLMNFYTDYPTTFTGGNIMTRWANYANTPLDPVTKEMVYPALEEKLQGLSKHDKVERLLNLIQTGIVYEYDEVVWGEDRAFYAEETLFYPYADCEDRSILFSRLVRDLVDLDVVLVYYPGHLATAVAFDEDVRGDYLVLDNRKFTVCDPTYINATSGNTMPGCDNSQAQVILLNRK